MFNSCTVLTQSTGSVMCSSVGALATIYGKGCIAKTSRRTGQHYQLFYNRALLFSSCRCTIRKQSLTRLAQLCKVYSTIVQGDWVGRLSKSIKKCHFVYRPILALYSHIEARSRYVIQKFTELGISIQNFVFIFY
jgi:hypothetical protein